MNEAHCKEAAGGLKGSAWWITPVYKAAAGRIWPGHPPSARLFLETAEMQHMRSCITILPLPMKTDSEEKHFHLSSTAEHRQEGRMERRGWNTLKSIKCGNSLMLLVFVVVNVLTYLWPKETWSSNSAWSPSPFEKRHLTINHKPELHRINAATINLLVIYL